MANGAKTSDQDPRCPMPTRRRLAEGRDQGRAVRRYLEALEAHKPKRGRKRTPESVQKRLATIDEQAERRRRPHPPAPRPGANEPGERAGVHRQYASTCQALEDEFVAAAAPYGARKGITYAAWRELGVDPAVLRRAGIKRGADS